MANVIIPEVKLDERIGGQTAEELYRRWKIEYEKTQEQWQPVNVRSELSL